jgi:dipeptidyl aminopeptidase/acylaminoacyl peptidase
MSSSRKPRSCALLALTLLGLAPLSALAGYSTPPAELLKVLQAPPPASPSVDPTGQRLLLATAQTYPSIERVAQPYYKLAGVRLEPANRSRHDTRAGYGIPSCVAELSLLDIASGTQRKLSLPAGGCAGNPIWSPDGQRFALQNVSANTVELWLGDVASAQLHKVDGLALNPIFDSSVQWFGGSQRLLVKKVPDGQGAPPTASAAEIGPDLQQALGGQGESSTYEARDTLRNSLDEARFAYYGSSQLALVDAGTGSVRNVGAAAIYNAVDAAPDGRHVLTETLLPPYSHAVTYQRFAHEVAVLEVDSGRVQRIAQLPLADHVPVRGVAEGPRNFDWRASEPATLVWAEALDKGDWKVDVSARDKVMTLSAPFSAQPRELTRTRQRFAGFAWTTRRDTSFLFEIDENRHWQTTRIVDLDHRGVPGRVLWDLSSDELYADPGDLVFQTQANGARVVRLQDNQVYLRGRGASPRGDRPFLDRLDLGSLRSERLFRSGTDDYDVFLALTAVPGQFLSWRQSPLDPPNAVLRTLGAALAQAPAGEAGYANSARQLTDFSDPTPEVRQIHKQLVNYQRADGVDLSFTLYTPPGYQPGQRLPAILYAYPADYASSAVAGQVSGSQNTFTRLSPYRLLLLAGYAIIDNASFPIVGDPRTAYDTYLQQLQANAEAAVNKAVELGVVDRNRIGVTGHSHGALMTANLLAHTSLFRAGVATSGSYNKTFTPFGFQNERRSVWQARDVYLQVSPYFHVDKIKAPLLLVHGEDDANPGTEPMQSLKLYQAIRGNGGTARLVMLPHEPHWYTALESNQQLVAEMLGWFDTYVKNAATDSAKN